MLLSTLGPLDHQWPTQFSKTFVRGQIDLHVLKPMGVICGLGGKPLDVITETELLITDAGPVKIMVTCGLPHHLMLGSDAIAAGHGVLDYENMRLQWYGKHYVLYDYPDYAPMLRQCTCIKPVGSKLLMW